MKPGLCIVGNGGMGDWHVRRAQAGGVVDVVAVHDIKESRNVFAEEKRGVKAYRTLDEVLCDKSIDIVTIATPNDVHESLAIACMEAGKHVISEKPVTLSVASLERMIAASERYGVKFSVHQNRRWDADYLVMKQLFETGAIGDVLNIESRVHGSRGVPGDWRAMKQYGGGMLYDWGVHMIDQLLMLFKDVKIESIFCQLDHITRN
ncbi:MAG: Gfo/Idh/MocA family oxidoreductase, partial [Clostridia bacterium]|nr:Gfo/Idh/MocA family oxidoreductase [Clostridia bacterium]